MLDSKKLRGNAWVFGDILDVDWEIFPFELVIPLMLQGKGTEEEYGKHCMEVLDPDFPKKVKKGDFIVAGENMGYGHDHEFGPMAIKGAGVAAVICDSTNRNFYRNAFHIGLPVIEYKGIKEKVKQGDELEVDLAAGTLRNLTTGEKLKFQPVPDFLLEMITAGGLYPLLKRKLAEGKISALHDASTG
jgi:3-isopropylmalate/(R)-2-methylmalate dehydratase small subunit